MPLRVVVGEDDVLFREGIARILEGAGLEVVAQTGRADDFLRRALLSQEPHEPLPTPVADQHRETAVAADRDHLTARVGERDAERIRHRVGHRCP
jgi:hypothetical protein